MNGLRWLLVSLLVSCAGASLALATGGGDVRVAKHDGTWEIAYGVVLFRIVGDVENISSKPVPYTRLAIDLLAPDGSVVQELVTYNQAAEALATLENETERKGFLEKLSPLEPGSKDSFRVGVAKDDLPEGTRLAGYRIRLVEPEGEPVTRIAMTEKSGSLTNLNTATKEELLALPGVNESHAAAILRHRETHGALLQPAEIRAVPQVAPVWEKIAPHVTVE